MRLCARSVLVEVLDDIAQTRLSPLFGGSARRLVEHRLDVHGAHGVAGEVAERSLSTSRSTVEIFPSADIIRYMASQIGPYSAETTASSAASGSSVETSPMPPTGAVHACVADPQAGNRRVRQPDHGSSVTPSQAGPRG